MPKGIPKRPSAHDRIDLLTSKLDDLAEVMQLLVDHVKIPKSQELSETPHSEVPVETSQNPSFETVQGLVPTKWKEIINRYLGNVEASMESTTGGHYVLTVYMPEGIDRRSGEAKKYSKDHSTGLIRYTSELADVEHWCELISKNIRKTFPNWELNK